MHKLHFMKLKASSLYWFGIFAFCFVSYQQISDNIRPYYNGNSAIIKYLLGVAPNFFPAIGIPAVFLLIFPELPTQKMWSLQKNHWVANAISIVGLVAWEFVQSTSKKLVFDWNDVLWTLIGAVCFQLIWFITPTRFKTF